MNTLESTTAPAALAGKYLTFSLRQESYAIPVLKIREIMRPTRITAVPQMPAHVCGVINLRGKIIPVMDLCRRLGFEGAETTAQTCVVVTQIKLPVGKIHQTGLVVDAVEEVVNIAATDIEPPPDLDTGMSAECVLGMAKIKGTVKTLLDIDRIVNAHPLNNLNLPKAGAPA